MRFAGSVALWRCGSWGRSGKGPVLEEALETKTEGMNFMDRLEHLGIVSWLAYLKTDVQPPLADKNEPLLSHSDVTVRLNAVRCLWNMTQDPVRVMPVLLNTLNLKDERLWRYKCSAVEIPTLMGPAASGAVPVLEEILSRPGNGEIWRVADEPLEAIRGAAEPVSPNAAGVFSPAGR